MCASLAHDYIIIRSLGSGNTGDDVIREPHGEKLTSDEIVTSQIDIDYLPEPRSAMQALLRLSRINITRPLSPSQCWRIGI